MSNNIILNIKALIESIEKIELYSKEFTNADEIWDIINTKLLPLKSDIEKLLKTV